MTDNEIQEKRTDLKRYRDSVLSETTVKDGTCGLDAVTQILSHHQYNVEIACYGETFVIGNINDGGPIGTGLSLLTALADYFSCLSDCTYDYISERAENWMDDDPTFKMYKPQTRH